MDENTEVVEDVSLHAELSQAFEASETPEEKPETNPISEAARTLASARRKAAEKAAEAVEKTETPEVKPEQEVKPETPETEVLEAPAHWAQADRELFAKQTPEVKQWMLARHKAMEGDYTRRVNELVPAKKLRESLDQVFAPYREVMARDGVDEITAIKQLVAAHDYLQRDPQNAIAWLAKSYGIDLSQPGGGENAQPSPELVQMRQQYAQMQSQLNSILSAQEKAKQQEHLAQVEQFAQEKDSQGKPLRPHFEEVATDMSFLLRAARESGQTLSLQDAYDRAVFANPDTRAKVLAAQEAERKAKEVEERERKAREAKKAGFDVRGTGAAEPLAARTNSIREDLVAAFDGSGARV